jgi:hypothetical protein
MKYTRKMVLVDYDKYNNNNINQKKEINVKPKPLFNLDKSMHEILQRNDLSDYEKHKLYFSKLNKFLFFIKQKSKAHVKDEPMFDIKKPKTEARPKSEPESQHESQPDSDTDSFHDEKTSNDEFFDISQSEEDAPFVTLKPRPRQKNQTLSNFSLELNNPSTSKENTTSTPKRKKRKYMKKKTVPREGSPINLRSSRFKNQLGGWFTFNDMLKNYKIKIRK